MVREEGPQGIKFYALPGDGEGMMHEEKFKRALFEGSAREQVEAVVDKELARETSRVTAKVLEECRPDILLCVPLNSELCLAWGQKNNRLVVVCCVFPYFPSSHYTPIGIPISSKLTLLNNLISWGFRRFVFDLYKDIVNPYRSLLGIPAVSNMSWNAAPHLNFYSPHLFPDPPDWPRGFPKRF